MEKLLFDTFEGLSLTDRQKKIFSSVFVKRVILSKESKLLFIELPEC